jgi:release factor glutamine methyltransferase
VTVLEIIQRTTPFLANKGVESPRLQVELLLAHVLHLPRLRLYLEFERQMTEPELETLRELVRRRGRREPLQHILGSASFCGLDLQTTPAVLIPRPETELLAERAWTRANELAGAAPSSGNPIQVLDFGTGSGCLAIAIAVHCPQTQVTALDLSQEALEVARQNASRHGVTDRIEWIAGDGFGALRVGQRFDLVVSNPPYIPTAEIATLEPEVRDHDPRMALDGGPDGLSSYRSIAMEGPGVMKPGGALMLELGDGQDQAVRALLESENWIVERVEPDYTARLRILTARRAS